MVKKDSFGGLFVFIAAILCVGISSAGVACGLPADWKSEGGFRTGVVQQVFDGDTIELVGGEKVRLVGVNTPETKKPERPAEPYAEAAARHLRKLLPVRSQVILQEAVQGRDRYGRTLAYVFTPVGRNVTQELLLQGYGFQVAIPPNLSYAPCYHAAQAQARNARLKVWADPYYKPMDAARPATLRGGFGVVRGVVQKVVPVRDLIWVDLVGHVSLRFDRKDALYLRTDSLKRLLRFKPGEAPITIEASGWLIDRLEWGKGMAAKIESGQRKRWMINVRHKYHWAIVSRQAM